jgi:hypothetical protein
LGLEHDDVWLHAGGSLDDSRAPVLDNVVPALFEQKAGDPRELPVAQCQKDAKRPQSADLRGWIGSSRTRVGSSCHRAVHQSFPARACLCSQG